MQITKQDYETIIFLTRLVYYDLDYPHMFKCLKQVDLLSGLRLNIFDMGEYDLYVLCGTNGLNDWVANIKVGLGITPRQYKRAYKEIHEFSMERERPMIIVGHSLGGGIAEYASSKIVGDVVCITFNGCGCLHLIDKPLEQTYNIITTRDILNGITERIPFAKKYMKHGGIKIYVKDKGFFPLSVKSHCNFLIFDEIDTNEIVKQMNRSDKQ